MVSGTPAVSVIILSYNRSDYLRIALESVAAQSATSIEVVVADDCSPDPTVDAVLEEYRPRFERFVYERPVRNVGVVANLLRAVHRSSGRYVTVLCDDDCFEPDFVARLQDVLDADPSRCAAFCNLQIIDGDGTPKARETAEFTARWKRGGMHTGPIDDFVDAALVTRSFQPAMGAMVRKDAVDWDDFPEHAAGAWDSWLSYLCARTGAGGSFVSETLFRYRQHPGALTSRRDLRWHRGMVYIYLRYRADDKLGSIDHVLRARLKRYNTELGMALLRKGENVEARESFRQAQKYGSAPKTLAGLALSRLPPRASQTIFRLYDR